MNTIIDNATMVRLERLVEEFGNANLKCATDPLGHLEEANRAKERIFVFIEENFRPKPKRNTKGRFSESPRA